MPIPSRCREALQLVVRQSFMLSESVWSEGFHSEAAGPILRSWFEVKARRHGTALDVLRGIQVA